MALNWLPNIISAAAPDSTRPLNLHTRPHQLLSAAAPDSASAISPHRLISCYFCSTSAFSLETRVYPRIFRRRNFKFGSIVPPRCSLPSSSSAEGKGEEEDKLGEARDALCDYLRQLGVSAEEALEIALAAPSYLQMLIDSIQDLDELSLWSSWADSASTAPHLQPTFRSKVFQMAQQKGDKGMLPYLESAGLTLSSATYLGRYLSSSHTLPDIIQKVKYLKEVLFSHSDDEGIVGMNARRMMKHLSISIDDDVQKTLSFFEKIQARRGGLDLLGSKDSSFRFLIESFPRLLLLPLETTVEPVLQVLEDVGVAHGSKRQILLLFPPIIFYNVEKDIRPRLHSFIKIGAADKDFGQMLLKYPWVLSASILQNYERILDFFNKKKIPVASVARAIKRWPLLLGCSVDKMNSMLDQFKDLGIVNKKLGKVIATSPQLLVQKPQDFLKVGVMTASPTLCRPYLWDSIGLLLFIEVHNYLDYQKEYLKRILKDGKLPGNYQRELGIVVHFLGDLGVDEDVLVKILVRCPEIFGSSIERTLERKLNFLNTIGISKSHFPRVIRKYPEFFICDVDGALLPRVGYLRRVGISKRDISFMVRKFSPLLGYSIEEVLRPKVEFLVNTMGRGINEVVEYPRYFSYSLEKRIKPRYWVLKGRNVDCSLKDMLGKNDEEFLSDLMGVERMLIPPS